MDKKRRFCRPSACVAALCTMLSGCAVSWPQPRVDYPNPPKASELRATDASRTLPTPEAEDKALGYVHRLRDTFLVRSRFNRWAIYWGAAAGTVATGTIVIIESNKKESKDETTAAVAGAGVIVTALMAAFTSEPKARIYEEAAGTLTDLERQYLKKPAASRNPLELYGEARGVLSELEHRLTHETLQVEATLQILTDSNLGKTKVGSDYAQAIMGTGGKPPYKWSLFEQTSLPKGLKLLSTSSSAFVHGRPDGEGKSKFKIIMVDSSGKSQTKEFELEITK